MEDQKLTDEIDALEKYRALLVSKRKLATKFTFRSFLALLGNGPLIGGMVFISASITAITLTIPAKLVTYVITYLWNLV